MSFLSPAAQDSKCRTRNSEADEEYSMARGRYGPNYASQLLEQYKVYAELTDRVGQRKEQVNRLYVTLFSALIAASSLAVVSWPDKFTNITDKLFLVLPIGIIAVGLSLVLAWFVSLVSLEKLLYVRLETIREMESGLAFPVFTEEIKKWRSADPLSKFRVTPPVFALPVVFLAIFCVLSLVTGILIAY